MDVLGISKKQIERFLKYKTVALIDNIFQQKPWAQPSSRHFDFRASMNLSAYSVPRLGVLVGQHCFRLSQQVTPHCQAKHTTSSGNFEFAHVTVPRYLNDEVVHLNEEQGLLLLRMSITAGRRCPLHREGLSNRPGVGSIIWNIHALILLIQAQ